MFPGGPAAVLLRGGERVPAAVIVEDNLVLVLLQPRGSEMERFRPPASEIDKSGLT